MTKILYISPQFPKVRHGFELVELQELVGRVDIEVLSLRSCAPIDWDWLRSAWKHKCPVRIRTISLSNHWWKLPAAIGRLILSRAVWQLVIPALRSDLRGGAKVAAGALAAALVCDDIRRKNFDLIHADFASSPATVAAVLSLLVGVPFTLCGHAFDVFSSKPAGRASEYVLRWKLQRCAIAYAENSAVVRVFRRYRTDVVLKRNASVSNAAGAQIDAVRPAMHLVGLGALVPKKGFDILIKAVAMLKSRYPELRISIYGEGPQRLLLEQLATTLDVPCNLPGAYLFGDLTRILEGASMVIVPSRQMPDNDSDGVPTVFIEALHTTCPVVGTDVGAVRDLIEDRVTGALVPPESPALLAEAIDGFLADPTFAVETAKRGRELVRSEYSVIRNTDILMEAWTGVLS